MSSQVGDEWIAFLKRTMAYHVSSINLLAEGQVTTAEVRGDVLVDTSCATLANHKERLAEVEAMLNRYL